MGPTPLGPTYGFAVEPKIGERAARKNDFSTSVDQLDERLKTQIRERWVGYFERYGFT